MVVSKSTERRESLMAEESDGQKPVSLQLKVLCTAEATNRKSSFEESKTQASFRLMFSVMRCGRYTSPLLLLNKATS